MQLSIDGFVAGPNGELDWMTWHWDEALNDYVRALTEPIDCILIGRKMAKDFIDAWIARAADPETADFFTHKMNDTPKLVFSRTLQHLDWKDASLAKGDLVTTVTDLKNQPGGDLIVYGGADFVSSLIEHGLIDDLYLFINPASIVHGLTIFKERHDLKLIRSQGFECGVVVLHYQPTAKVEAE